ncbi:amidase [Methylobacterium sp. P31]
MNRRRFLKNSCLASLSATAAAAQLPLASAAAAQANSSDPLNAFVSYGPINIQKSKTGPLAGLRFSVKDSYDVAGYPTGTGSPAWLSTHPAAERNAPVVSQLLNAGATLVGKNQMDELAWSLMGENVHYGTPTNPAAPDRIPGGSSSGPASAVAGGAVDFAMGGDTGGSIRVPSAFCGIYGIRPTQGRVSDVGTTPLAPTFDTVGWFAGSPGLMQRIGDVLLGETAPTTKPRLIILASDQFDLAGSDVSSAVEQTVNRLVNIVGSKEVVALGAPAERKAWADAFRTMQAYEIWKTHGEWVTSAKPSFGPGIGDRFASASKVTDQQYADAKGLREKITARLNDILSEDTVLVYPTTPGIAPKLHTPEVELNAFRNRLLEMLCPVSHAGVPQMSIPAGKIQGAPVGLSLVGPRNTEATLLALANMV